MTVLRESPHLFHIPVMGTGFTIDSPVRIAQYGITSVVSLVDDLLLEQMRSYHSKRNGIDYEVAKAPGAEVRSERIRLYFDLLQTLVDQQIEAMKALPFGEDNAKDRYFRLLPNSAPERLQFLAAEEIGWNNLTRLQVDQLNETIRPGLIEANIMVKLDAMPKSELVRDGKGRKELSDASQALKGFAQSKARGNLVLSAGFNRTLSSQFDSYPCFYRNGEGVAEKGIVLKVSDFRSARIQGMFFAKRGIEIKEFRIESGLNCGGHAFPTEGHLIGPILQEFKDRRDEFSQEWWPHIQAFYSKRGLETPPEPLRPRVTYQGGVGNFGEMERLLRDYGVDSVGLASPFLLVPEVTSLDEESRQLLSRAQGNDIRLTNGSPLRIPFYSLKDCGVETYHKERIQAGKPGSPCPKRFLVSTKEFNPIPQCLASADYQKQKLKELGYDQAPPADTTDPQVRALYDKLCICHHLGNGVLLETGIKKNQMPVSVCPGPNTVYFNRITSLEQMLDHFYGRHGGLTPADRPHWFAKELQLYLDYFYGGTRERTGSGDPHQDDEAVRTNLLAGITYYEEFLASQSGYPDENLESLENLIADARAKLEAQAESSSSSLIRTGSA